VVVGLGNPGPEYRETRHNVGQGVVEHLAARLDRRFRTTPGAEVAEGPWDGGWLVLAKPEAFMNVSGPAVARVLRDAGVGPADLILTHDDLDLPFGRVRLRHGGRHGGHNGVRSVLDTLGTERIRRVKVGIGRPAERADTVDWVLTGFTPEERAALPALLARAGDLVMALAAEPPEVTSSGESPGDGDEPGQDFLPPGPAGAWTG
jgi:PTH1 family peptidyl-tRNA hydrolase